MKSVLIAAGVAIVFSSCTKEGPMGPSGTNGTNGAAGAAGATGATGPAGPVFTANYVGQVQLFDQYNSRIFSNMNGVTVSIDGTTKTTTTDVDGKYSFSKLNSGIYYITYTKTGFGTNKVLTQIVGGADSTLWGRDVRLSQIPNFNALTVTADTLTSGGAKYMSVKGTITADNTSRARALMVYISKTATVSSKPADFLFLYSVGVGINATTWVLNIPRVDLTNMGIATGQTVYFAVYGVASGAPAYTDINTERPVYTAISTTMVTANAVLK